MMMQILTCPQYDSIRLPEHIAWPETYEDACTLARALTGRKCEVTRLCLEALVAMTLGVIEMGVLIDGTDYTIVYTIHGTYHDRKASDVTRQDLMAVIGDVHVIQERHDPA